MSRILVTGATGNIGMPVVRELLRCGYDVIALVRPDTPPPDGCEVVRGRLEHASAFARAAAGCDGILHLASGRADERARVVEEDVLPLAALLDAWQRGPFVYASSQTVYGVPRGPLDENAPLNPFCWYDWAKVVNESQLTVAAVERGGNCVPIALRLPLLFGAGPRRGDRQFLRDVVHHCAAGGVFGFDSELAWLEAGSSFIGEADAGRAFARAVRITEGGPFNVASGFCLWRELIGVTAEALGVEARVRIRPPGSETPHELRLPQSVSRLEVARFVSVAGFRAEDTLVSLVESFVEQELRDGLLESA